tara:strand:+ start:191 stop:595 length:405 start_codon:yes stop_codon:yes gene_type:complete
MSIGDMNFKEDSEQAKEAIKDLTGQWAPDEKELAKWAIEKFSLIAVMLMLRVMLEATPDNQKRETLESIISAWKASIEEDMSGILEGNELLRKDVIMSKLLGPMLEDTVTMHQKYDIVLSQVEDIIRGALTIKT